MGGDISGNVIIDDAEHEQIAISTIAVNILLRYAINGELPTQQDIDLTISYFFPNSTQRVNEITSLFEASIKEVFANYPGF